MTIIDAAQIYWYASAEGLQEIMQKFSTTLDDLVVVSERVANKLYKNHEHHLVDFTLPVYTKMFLSKSGETVTLSDLSLVEIQELVESGAILELMVPSDKTRSIGITLLDKEMSDKVISRAIMPLDKAMESHGFLFELVYGSPMPDGLIDSLKHGDNDTLAVEAILTVLRSAAGDKRMNLLEPGYSHEVIDNMARTLEANYISKMLS